MPAAQNQYRDRLFNFIFGSEAHREWTLSLYNAINGTAYDDPSLIQFTTIREILYLGMRNDVSFLVGMLLSLYEQQSTYNPNMPLRFLEYLGDMYERYIRFHKRNKYGKKLIQLPVPKLVVFYNGTDAVEEEMPLYLTDAFPEDLRGESDVQVRVRMIDVNRGKNRALMDACKPLNEYAWIVDRIRENERALKATMDSPLEAAIDRMIDALPDDFVTKPFLIAHRAEVKGMLLTEYNEAEAMELFKEEGREEGFLLLSALIKKLRSMGRIDDVFRVTEDPAYRDKLIVELGLA